MLGFKELINRYRHNRGFGVQSPRAFHFVTSVLKESHPYYDYAFINGVAAKCDGGKSAHCRMLYRIVNHVQPSNIVMFAPHGVAACAIAAAKRHVPAYVLNAPSTISLPEVASFMAARGCRMLSGGISPVIDATDKIGLLYVGRSFSYAAVVEEAIKHVAPDSVIIVEKIHSSPEMRQWWQKIKEHPEVCVTFDLYSMGLLFFDKNYKKQHYTLKM
ncbi:MAG: hypothetical protein IKU35_10750 [Bacteroidaceae bacterium]|nr:hypothetical protein [Bacteroidaceae bacterium]MBR5277595.1 hypothetical protein [Bacteroidaceae bacterium]